MKFNNKISKLEDSIIKDKDLNFAKENFTVFISVSDSINKAYITNSTKSTLKKAIEEAKKEMLSKIKKYDINPEWVKLDVINDNKEILSKNFESEVTNLNNNTYRKGIAFDENFDIALLEAEINSNSIIDYKQKELDLSKLNKYITSDRKTKDKLKSFPEKLITFTSVGFNRCC